MSQSEPLKEFRILFESSLKENTFINLSLGNYKGIDDGLKNIYAKKAIIKKEEKLSFTYRYKTKDIVKNYDFLMAADLVTECLTSGFRVGNLFTTKANTSFEIQNNGKTAIRNTPPTSTSLPPPDHDKQKKRLITTSDKPYLTALRITDQEGNVFKNAQDKYRQINHYVEILSTLLKDIPAREQFHVVDMGSGKGYLTFALYDYLQNVMKVKAQVTGVEFRPDMVALCNRIASDSGFENLRFEEGTIENYNSNNTNILIALHACDTATDDAIFKGITGNADLIVVAPCCHKQIRREMEKHRVQNNVDFLTRYGIFMERQAEMVTDGIRAMILEYFGYKTKVFEFISNAHTPKNVLIVGTKTQQTEERDDKLLQKIKGTKAYFGIEFHHLERMLEI